MKSKSLNKIIKKLNSFEKIEDAIDYAKNISFELTDNKLIRYIRKKIKNIYGIQTIEVIGITDNGFVNFSMPFIPSVSTDNYWKLTSKKEGNKRIIGSTNGKYLSEEQVEMSNEENEFNFGEFVPGPVEALAQIDMDSPEHFDGIVFSLSKVGFEKQNCINSNWELFTKTIVMPTWDMRHPETKEKIKVKYVPVEYSILVEYETLNKYIGYSRIIPDNCCHYFKSENGQKIGTIKLLSLL